jgi:hypothetical protein
MKLMGMIAARAEAEKMSALRSLLKKSGRFTEGGEGVVVDSKTRLMWSLLDARGMMPSEDCIDYEKAKNHVKNLSIGGYRDWRLPTIDELKGIYKSAPVFPLAGANEWYWTSEHFTSYADGWQQIKVDTLARETGAEWLSTHRDSRECGNVRAVRSP